MRRNGYVTALAAIMLLDTAVYGGYHTFTVCLSGAALLVLLTVRLLRERRLTLPRGPELWLLAGLCLCQLASLPFAVSAGGTLAGLLRMLTLLLFALCVGFCGADERHFLADAVALETALLSALYIILFLIGRALGQPDVNGRLDGPLEYANAWAMLQCCALLLLLRRPERRRPDYPAMAVLLLGIVLTGSRGVLLLSAALGLFLLPRALKGGKRRAALLGLLACGLLAAAGFLLGGSLTERLRALLTGSYSLYGRLLYLRDGLRMLLRHPLGLGRDGYFYLQTAEQTGIYTVRHVHNACLQAALDGGIIAGLLLLALLVCLLRREAFPGARLVVLALALHSFVDFDLEYSAIFFLLLLCGMGTERRELRLPERRGGGAAVPLLAAALVLCFFGGVYLLSFLGFARQAAVLFPADLALLENDMQSRSDETEAEAVADRILERTGLSMLAWDCKRVCVRLRGDPEAEAEALLGYLRINRYRGEVYEELSLLLYAIRAGDNAPRVRELAAETAALLRETEARTDPLAWKLSVTPNFEFRDAVLDRLDTILTDGTN